MLLKYTTLLVFLFAFASNLTGQDFEKPDYRQIDKNISKKKSELYFPKLLKRYNDGDTSLSLNEKRHLYYGFTFQKSYDPYGDSDYEDSLGLLLSKDTLGLLDFEKILEFGELIIAEDPFALRVLNYMLYASEKLQNSAEFNKRYSQINTVVDVLFSSGDGRSKESAFYVIATSHEYFLLNVLGVDFGGNQSLSGNYDILTLAENEYDVEELYFDVSPCLKHLNSMFDK